jgi:hypothetical protein
VISFRCCHNNNFKFSREKKKEKKNQNQNEIIAASKLTGMKSKLAFFLCFTVRVTLLINLSAKFDCSYCR